MQGFCYECRKDVELSVTQREETYTLRGVDVTVTSNVCACPNCGSDVWQPDIEDDNLNRLYDAYEQKTGKKIRRTN